MKTQTFHGSSSSSSTLSLSSLRALLREADSQSLHVRDSPKLALHHRIYREERAIHGLGQGVGATDTLSFPLPYLVNTAQQAVLMPLGSIETISGTDFQPFRFLLIFAYYKP